MAKHRAAVREQQRQQALRVCTEGEHGTTWQEDCKTCRCDHGRRSCPPVVCTHGDESSPRAKHPREL